jgi:hypothetical protein
MMTDYLLSRVEELGRQTVDQIRSPRGGVISSTYDKAKSISGNRVAAAARRVQTDARGISGSENGYILVN